MTIRLKKAKMSKNHQNQKYSAEDSTLKIARTETYFSPENCIVLYLSSELDDRFWLESESGLRFSKSLNQKITLLFILPITVGSHL